MNYDYVRDFLIREANCLDEHDWDAWLDMYAKDVTFWVPAWDVDGELTRDPQKEISLMYYARRDGLEDRVFRIRTERSTASTPPPRTAHNISNIQLIEVGGEACAVRFNWLTMSYRFKTVSQFFGTSTYRIVVDHGVPLVKEKKVVLKNDCIHQVLDIYHI
ncbi:aromatic-ring-hydroxylating dioxygenase subunit beta [Thauera sinica]|uniref:Aromatic-ring-hydroxylating dioxygenase subunit beta n=1 Tax=Thauera sinica TaxID=2665146 RepID=A0ABW1ALJ6_9RHOO|nr:aromatic-ring-hydroxylating dioxygenase subunit beta [Thauera sp. K11]